MMAAVCLMAAMTFAAQCAATTKKGTQCKRQASPGSEFCWQHGGTTKAERAANGESEAPKRARKSAKAETEAPTEPAANDAPAVAEGQCQATTRRGTPCKRKAQAGGNEELPAHIGVSYELHSVHQIPGAPDGSDYLRVLGVPFQLVSQAIDINFDGVVIRFRIISPYIIHQLLLGKNNSGIG